MKIFLDKLDKKELGEIKFEQTTMKKIEVNSKHQKGGITAGIINVKKATKEGKLSKSAAIATIILLVIGVLTFFGYDMFFKKDQNLPKEEYHVSSTDQKGGVTAGKIEQLNIITEKNLIKEPLGLYRDEKHVGTVKNPQINEAEKSITFEQVLFIGQWADFNDFLEFTQEPFIFRDFTIQITGEESLSMMPPVGKNSMAKIL